MHGACERLSVALFHPSVAPVADGIYAPFVHTLDGKVNGGLFKVGTEAAFQIPCGIIGCPVSASVCIYELLRWELFQHICTFVQILDVSASCRRDAAYAYTEETVSIRIYKPPAAIFQFFVEETGSLGLLRQVTTVARVAVEVLCGNFFLFLGFPYFLQFLEVVCLARPIYKIALSQLVNGRFLAEIKVSGIFGKEFNVADFHPCVFEWPVLSDTDGINTNHRASGASEIDPSRLAGLVVHAGHIVRTGGRLR